MTKCFDSELRLLTIKEAAHLLNIKISRLRSLIFKREIPYIKIGSLVRFNTNHLVEWINQKTVF